MRRLCLLSVCFGLALGGCGGDDDESTPAGGGGSAPGGGTVTVAMKDVKFDPRAVTIEAGQTVRWVNEDTIDHNAVATDGADFRSELFGKGESFEWKAEGSGTVKYECTIHPGMEGTIEVR